MGLANVGVNGLVLILQNHSPRQPHICVNTPKNVTRWEYLSGVFDCISFLLKGVLYALHSIDILPYFGKVWKERSRDKTVKARSGVERTLQGRTIYILVIKNCKNQKVLISKYSCVTKDITCHF